MEIGARQCVRPWENQKSSEPVLVLQGTFLQLTSQERAIWMILLQSTSSQNVLSRLPSIVIAGWLIEELKESGARMAIYYLGYIEA